MGKDEPLVFKIDQLQLKYKLLKNYKEFVTPCVLSKLTSYFELEDVPDLQFALLCYFAKKSGEPRSLFHKSAEFPEKRSD